MADEQRDPVAQAIDAAARRIESAILRAGYIQAAAVLLAPVKERDSESCVEYTAGLDKLAREIMDVSENFWEDMPKAKTGKARVVKPARGVSDIR